MSETDDGPLNLKACQAVLLVDEFNFRDLVLSGSSVTGHIVYDGDRIPGSVETNHVEITQGAVFCVLLFMNAHS